MHVFVLAETFGEDHEQFVGWLKSLRMKRSDEEKAKLIKAGMADPNPDLIDDARPIVREVRLYDVVIPEDNKDEFMSVLKGFQTQPLENIDTLRGKDEVKEKSIELCGSGLVKKLGRYLGKLIPGMDSVNMDDYKAHPTVRWTKWAYVYVLGLKKDQRSVDGVELT